MPKRNRSRSAKARHEATHQTGRPNVQPGIFQKFGSLFSGGTPAKHDAHQHAVSHKQPLVSEQNIRPIEPELDLAPTHLDPEVQQFLQELHRSLEVKQRGIVQKNASAPPVRPPKKEGKPLLARFLGNRVHPKTIEKKEVSAELLPELHESIQRKEKEIESVPPPVLSIREEPVAPQKEEVSAPIIQEQTVEEERIPEPIVLPEEAPEPVTEISSQAPVSMESLLEESQPIQEVEPTAELVPIEKKPHKPLFGGLWQRLGARRSTTKPPVVSAARSNPVHALGLFRRAKKSAPEVSIESETSASAETPPAVSLETLLSEQETAEPSTLTEAVPILQPEAEELPNALALEPVAPKPKKKFWSTWFSFRKKTVPETTDAEPVPSEQIESDSPESSSLPEAQPMRLAEFLGKSDATMTAQSAQSELPKQEAVTEVLADDTPTEITTTKEESIIQPQAVATEESEPVHAMAPLQTAASILDELAPAAESEEEPAVPKPKRHLRLPSFKFGSFFQRFRRSSLQETPNEIPLEEPEVPAVSSSQTAQIESIEPEAEVPLPSHEEQLEPQVPVVSQPEFFTADSPFKRQPKPRRKLRLRPHLNFGAFFQALRLRFRRTSAPPKPDLAAESLPTKIPEVPNLSPETAQDQTLAAPITAESLPVPKPVSSGHLLPHETEQKSEPTMAFKEPDEEESVRAPEPVVTAEPLQTASTLLEELAAPKQSKESAAPSSLPFSGLLGRLRGKHAPEPAASEGIPLQTPPVAAVQTPEAVPEPEQTVVFREGTTPEQSSPVELSVEELPAPVKHKNARAKKHERAAEEPVAVVAEPAPIIPPEKLIKGRGGHLKSAGEDAINPDAPSALDEVVQQPVVAEIPHLSKVEAPKPVAAVVQPESKKVVEKVKKRMQRSKKQSSGFTEFLISLKYFGLGKERSNIIQNLATMMNAGLPLIDSIHTLQKETKTKPMKKMLQNVIDLVESGSPLWRALEAQHFFSPHAISLIRIGEEAGNLAENLEHLALQQEKDAALSGKIKMAMIYPTIVLVLMFIIVMGLGLFVLPNLISVLFSLNVKLPLVTRILVAFTKAFTKYAAIVVPGSIIGIVGIALIAKFTRLKVFFQWIMFHIPGIGRLAREATIARFGVILGSLLQAGVPLIEALNSLAEVTSSVSYKKFYFRLVEHVNLGDSFSKSFESIRGSTKLLPISVQQLVMTGERSGSLAKILMKVSDIYEKKANETAEKLPVILEPMLLLFIGGLVGTIAFAIIIPIYSVVGSVGKQ